MEIDLENKTQHLDSFLQSFARPKFHFTWIVISVCVQKVITVILLACIVPPS